LKEDLVIDVKEKHLVVEMEAKAASKETPALQKVPLTGDPFHLYLPRQHADLPAYCSKAEFLPWNHCPLCHKEVSVSKTQSWEAALEEHTQNVHKVSLAKVRRMVLETEMWRGPKAVSAQVMRTALHRFRCELTDDAFSLKPCACCTHGFLAKDLQTVRFPAFPFNTPDELPELPDWLVKWDASLWKKHGAAWLQAVDTCFSTQTYLDVHFRGPEREAYAKARAQLLRAHSSPNAAAAADALLA